MSDKNMPVIIDIESSGFGHSSYPIEIGLALENGKTKCFLIKPEEDWLHWDKNAAQLHGISRNQLLKNGKLIRNVCLHLNNLLKGKTVYSDAWSYDQSWLHLLFSRCNMTLKFRIESLVCLMNEKQMESWGSIKQQLQSKYNVRRHRASHDALLLQRTYTEIQTL